MKRTFLVLLTLSFASLVCSSYHDGVASRGLGNRTGTSSAHCSGNGCHSNGNFVPTAMSFALRNVNTPTGYLDTVYEPGQTYAVLFSVTVYDTTQTRNNQLGFQLSAVFDSTQQQAGTLQSGPQTHIANYSGIQLAEHDTTLPRGDRVPFYGYYGLKWTAPANSNRAVAFRVAVCVVNGDGTPNGDFTDYRQQKYNRKSPAGVTAIPASLGVSVFPNPVTDQLSIRAASAPAKAYSLYVFDLSGTLRLFQNLTGTALQQTETVSVAHLPAGFYRAHLTGGSSQETFSFIKK